MYNTASIARLFWAQQVCDTIGCLIFTYLDDWHMNIHQASLRWMSCHVHPFSFQQTWSHLGNRRHVQGERLSNDGSVADATTRPRVVFGSAAWTSRAWIDCCCTCRRHHRKFSRTEAGRQRVSSRKHLLFNFCICHKCIYSASMRSISCDILVRAIRVHWRTAELWAAWIEGCSWVDWQEIYKWRSGNWPRVPVWRCGAGDGGLWALVSL